MSAVLEIDGLRKTFRSVRRGARRALDGFDMVVESGQVHGFLGPNGSGKTTTLRALLGLVRADGGSMRLFGQPVPARLPTVIDRLGAIVESPQFFGNFSGQRTLRLLARASDVSNARVDEVLEIVGLRDRAKDKVRTYSLGMRQRLAVASGLLKAPDLLILDEPVNGLDPAGIREMRDLMRSVAAGGATVLISSHLLDEVEQICDTVTIISRGRRVTSGAVTEIRSSQDQGEFRVRVERQDEAAELLTGSGLTVRVAADHLVVGGVDDSTTISQTLGTRGLWVRELTPIVPDLESAFLALTDTTPEPGLRRQVDDSVFVDKGDPE
jgi:ABC-2 type transport system ATP-binding protein